MRETLTDDVRAWSPALSTASLDELLDELDRRDGAFADVELNVTALDVGGDHACVEWTVEMTHSGPIVLADEMHIESSGLRVAMHGITPSRSNQLRRVNGEGPPDDRPNHSTEAGPRSSWLTIDYDSLASRGDSLS